ncbi:MAG: PIN domain nuclease [Chloroflexi bacterium]|nr:PIN domain nuclease [Chloroflexota bacterium]
MLLLLRLFGMVVAGIAGWQLGLALAGYSPQAGIEVDALRYVLVLALAGAALGLLITPYVTVVPLQSLWALARGLAAPRLISATVGLGAGLLIALLAAFPIVLLPEPFGRWMPFGVAVLLGWLGTAIGIARADELLPLLRIGGAHGGRSGTAAASLDAVGQLLVDTSAIIDGRIVEISHTGFLPGRLTVPRFVLEELQRLSDSTDPGRRQRGRRGLQLLERLQREAVVEIVVDDVPDAKDVDGKLVRLARQRHAAIVTTDHNLYRVATIQSVVVLNVNDLANALRSVVAPGDELALDLVQEGRERGQGIGFLEDGTMVIVEGGRPHVGTKADVEVTRILPTVGGRLVFGRLKRTADGNEHPRAGNGQASARPASTRATLRVVRDTGECDEDDA